MSARHRFTKLSLMSVFIAVILAIPILVVIASIFWPDGGAWAHMRQTTLPLLVQDSLLLAALVACGVVVIGTSTAWLTTRYTWRGRRALEWLLVLPLAMPAYVMAFAYTDWLQYAGPVQTLLRETFGWQAKSDYWFPDIRSLGGAAAMLTLALYPYVYLLARVAFLAQPASLEDAGRTFGYTRRQLFWRVSLPMARPAIAAGAALATMETLADYGTVSYFGINTFTTGIFAAWFAQGDRIAAAKLATLLLCIVLVVSMLEGWARRRARFADSTESSYRTMPRIALNGVAANVVMAVCALPFLLGFLVPIGLLGWQVARESQSLLVFGRFTEFAALAWNSFSLAGLTALLAVAISLLLGYAKRRSAHWSIRASHRLVGLGYAVPGTVIAVGVLIPVIALDHQLADILSRLLGQETGLLLTGGISVLIYAYLIRFLAVSLQTVDAGFTRITPNMDDAARSLGMPHQRIMLVVHAPLLRTSLITAALLVFVDVMKELPATLVMRPFNFDTLAVRTYTFAKDERLAEAAIAAFTIVIVGMIPVIIASRAITKSDNTAHSTQSAHKIN